MTDTIDYFYTHVSPWAYLGHAPFMDMAARHGLTVRFRPVSLAEVFPETGGLPLAKRAPARQAYRWMELQRWVDKRGVKLNFKPAFFPADPTLADRVVLALSESGRDQDPFARRMFAACWAEDRNVADPDVVAGALRDLGEDADAVMQSAQSDAVGSVYAKNARDAVDIPIIGSPCYVRDGEPFWGQDRLDILEDAVRSGRPAYGPL